MSHVPSWVYLLFFGLVYMGIKGCFKRVIKTKLLILLPALFVWFSSESLYKAAQISFFHIIFYSIGALIGLYLGYLHVRKGIIRADKEQFLVELPGDWTILVLILIIFIIQFAVHYILAADPSLSRSGGVMALILFISGAATWVVVGRNLTYFYKFTKAHHEKL